MQYYGDKLSKNIIVTEEGYLICQNVPIGRVGWMEYLGQELPFQLPAHDKFKVGRTEEELFNPDTIASFEGKPVTNSHPQKLLDVTSATHSKCGHAQNVRREGEYLIADLFIDDPRLVQEIQSKAKREVSSGYNCAWIDIGNGRYEQREIVGNHIAIVKEGRAGPRVSIHDSKPLSIGGRKMGKITGDVLRALGLKTLAMDADPEQFVEGVKAIKEEDQVKDAEPPMKPPVEEQKAPMMDEDTNAMLSQIVETLETVVERLVQLEQAGSAGAEKSAKDVLDEMAETLGGKEEEEEELPPADTEETAEADEPLKKFAQDMKPLIMSIKDDGLRMAAAQCLVSFVKDARGGTADNGYGKIAKAAMDHKRSAADRSQQQDSSIAKQADQAAQAWQARGVQMRGGSK